MAHKKAAGSAKNLRDSKPKYRGVKVYGGQPVKAGDIIIRQKGDTYKLGSNVYKSKDFSIHASVDGTVQFGKKNYTRFDGKVYLKTFVEVVENIADASKKASSHKTTHSQEKITTTSSYSKKDLSGKTVAELTDIAKEMNLSGYSSLKKAELIDFIYDSLS